VELGEENGGNLAQSLEKTGGAGGLCDIVKENGMVDTVVRSWDMDLWTVITKNQEEYLRQILISGSGVNY